jgi:ubiquinone/menaquinone biosynthesis C-methylase UbiE
VRFDPAEWSAIYESPRPGGAAFVFRRGAELALDACLGLAEPGEHWVDVGAGTGHLAERLVAAGVEVTGVDRDPRMVDTANRRCGPEALSNGLHFAVAEANSLPFADAAVDGVVATAVAGLLPNLGSFLREAHRVLRPGGSAVITFTNRSSPLHARRSRRYAAAAHRYTRDEAVSELERAGFAIARTYLYNFFLSPGGRMWPPRDVALFLEPRLQRPVGALLARNLLASAVKC